MYRLLIPVLYLGVVAGAPQDGNKSEETYVKIQTINETTFQNLTPGLSVTNLNESENNDINRQVRSDDVTTELESEITTEIADATDTTDASDQAVQPAEDIKTLTNSPSPRFFSKLSYFQKPSFIESSPLTNSVEHAVKRKFKSRCRCEKIWNCPKLQITVPRCPDEYFLCCF